MRAALGSIERLSQGRYRVSIEGKPREDGRRHRVTKVVRGTREDAEVALAKIKLAAGKGDGSADGMTVDMAWRAYYEPTFDARLAPASCKKYRSDYAANIKPLFGDVRMKDLTTRGIEQKLLTIEAEYPRDHAFRLFRSFVNYLWNRDLISENPFQKRMDVKGPRRHEQPTMGFAELREWSEGMRGFRHEAVMLLYPYAGLRRGEGVGLMVEDLAYTEMDGVPLLLAHVARSVDEDGNETRAKTERSERTVVVAGSAAARVRDLASEMGPGWLCRAEDGSRVSPHLLACRYKAWCERNGMPWYTIKQLRTTFATLSQASGVDAAVTSRALGHTKLSMDYEHYFMSNMPAQINAAKALSNSVSYTMFRDGFSGFQRLGV